jgi:predicted SprT family Zn-dependent metalloprotease
VQVIDNETRLRSTLSHEMCHVAAWVISKEWKEHHGSVFWEWAHRFEALVPDIKITTCHNFDVHAPFRWQCSNYRWAADLAASLLIGAAVYCNVCCCIAVHHARGQSMCEMLGGPC